MPRARASTTRPLSSGWRSACRVAVAISGASSRKRTPRWASDSAPGRASPLPPPTSAAELALWCGAWNGGRRIRWPSCGQHPGDRVQRGHLERRRRRPARAGSTAGVRPASSCLRRAGRTGRGGARRPRPPRGRTGRAPGRPRRRDPGRAGAAPGRRGGGSSSGPAPRTKSTRRRSESTARTVTPGTTVASRALASGTITRVRPARAAAATIGRTPRTGSDGAVESELAEHDDPVEAAGRQLAGAGEEGRGDGEVEGAAVLGQGGGQQVDRDPAVGPGQAGVDHGGADPVAGLVQRGVGQAGQHAPRAGRRRGRPPPRRRGR